MGTLLLRPKSDNGAEANEGRFILFLQTFLNSIRDGGKIVVTIVYVQNLPTIGQEALLDIFGEGTSGITIDGDVCKV